MSGDQNAVDRALAFLDACVRAGEMQPDGAENPCDVWEALSALSSRAVPMEAVAWRSRYRPGKGDAAWTYHEREPSFLVGLKTDYEVQALAVIPAPGKENGR